MTAANKIRIYELAKEVKQEPKRVIEDARKFGVDVSVPSNSVPKEVAEKIREKYDLGKKDLTPKRSIVVIKKQKTDDAPTLDAAVATETVAPTMTAPVADPAIGNGNGASAEFVQPSAEAEKPASRVVKVVSKKAVEAQQQQERTASPIAIAPEPEVVAAQPEPPPKIVAEPATLVVAEPLAPETSTVNLLDAAARDEVEEAALVEKPEDKAGSKVFNPASSGVTRLKLNQAGLKAGFRPGERVNIPQPTVTPRPIVSPPQQQQTPGERPPFEPRTGDLRQTLNNRFVPSNNRSGAMPSQQRSGGDNRPQFRGTPGETATPQTTYTPPANNRSKGRNVKGGKQDKHGRDKFAEKDVFVPERLTIEQRLRNQVGTKQDAELKGIRLVEGATVREFAEKLGVAPRDIVQLLIKRGIFATVNQPLNTEIATDLGINFGYQVTFMPFEEMVIEQEFEELLETDSDDTEVTRAPVVTVMGHVDHGKTSLLDGIRMANVAGGEAGGITQHIGAYSVFVPTSDNPAENRRVVFLDTPGHEAFTMMRARGAKATDVVVLVVAADDGVMPQTIEAIEHAKAAKVPIVVAINKIDKPDASPDKVKQELTGHGLQPVEWGGDTEMVEVSAKKKQNLDTLLETILLTADILDLKASPTRRASGVVLESKLDKGRGSVATVLVQQGTLRVGDPFIVGNYSGKVRAMFSDRGEIVTDAQPATPVEVLGLQGVPQAGDPLQVVVDVDRAQQISNQRLMQARQAALVQTTKRGLESLGQAEFKELLVVLKTDVQGSIEVLRATLEKLSTEKVKVKVIRSGVGAITESDVLLASATQADSQQTAVVIIGFNVRPESRAAEVAKSETVDIRLHSIIYKVEEEIRAAMIGMLDAIEREVILGHALVQQVFKITRVGTIAGCRVLDGVIKRTVKARLIRDGVVAWEGEIDSLKRVKEDAAEVREGFECGIGLRNFNDVKVDDQIEAYTIEKIAATEL